MLNYRRKNADFGQFLKVLRRQGKPDYLPFYEHGYHPAFIARATGTPFDKMPFGSKEYWRTYVNFWLDIGYDCIPMEIPPQIRLPEHEQREGRGLESEQFACIFSMEDLEQFGWPEDESPVDFGHFETVASMLPDGIKIVGGVSGGPYEWSTYLLGVMGLFVGLAENPELVKGVYDRLARIYLSADRQLASMDAVGALRQGDDLGYKSSTFIKPDYLRELVFPIYKQMASLAHANGKPFILHSCGNLEAIYDDLIDECRIDAKHSFEDVILPVDQFKQRYGKRITPLGGLDVDTICRSDEQTLRKYARECIEKCFYDGYWALGSGNSLTDYMPVENYLIVIEEGLKVEGK